VYTTGSTNEGLPSAQVRGNPKLLHPWLASTRDSIFMRTLVPPAVGGRTDYWPLAAVALHTLAWVSACTPCLSSPTVEMPLMLPIRWLDASRPEEQ
jgi:hypothetical protein